MTNRKYLETKKRKRGEYNGVRGTTPGNRHTSNVISVRMSRLGSKVRHVLGRCIQREIAVFGKRETEGAEGDKGGREMEGYEEVRKRDGRMTECIAVVAEAAAASRTGSSSIAYRIG